MLKHQAVRDHVLALLRDGLEPHERIPTERDLSAQLGVSRLTVRRAVEQLVHERVLYRIQGSGTFVAEPLIRKGSDLTSFSEDMRERGRIPSTRVLQVEHVVAGAFEGWRLGVSPGEPLHHLTRLRLADGRPMCLEEVWLVASLTPGLTERDLTGSLYDTLREAYRIEPESAEQEVRATVLDEGQAGLLEVPTLSPAIVVERVTFDAKGRAYELGVSRYRGDRYSLTLTLTRHHD